VGEEGAQRGAATSQVNSTGDDQKKLDVLSDEIFVSVLSEPPLLARIGRATGPAPTRWPGSPRTQLPLSSRPRARRARRALPRPPQALINSGACAVLVSEERDEAIIVPEEKAGRFCVAFDPLDGSSNIDCNVSTGTIFAVYEKKTPGKLGSVADVLRVGSDIVAAGYCMYGAATEMVLCFKGATGVERFTLDPSLGEFCRTHSGVTFPAGGGKKIYSCNEGNSPYWDKPIQDAVADFKVKKYAARYVGSMVSDVHRTILYGGIFLYPADTKSPKGKLRVLYEGFPMALLVEAAGGKASTGMFNGSVQRMLDLVPTTIHERCPVILGSPRDVDLVLSRYN